MFCRGKTSGIGLVCTIYHEALEKSTQSDRWTASTTKGNHVLHLARNTYLNTWDKTKDYQVEGNLAALYLSHLAVGPDPISPFVILAASIDSLDHFNFDLNFAKAMIHDQETLNKIEQIINLHTDEPVKGDWLVQLAEDVQVPVSVVGLYETMLISFPVSKYYRWTPDSCAPEHAKADACNSPCRTS